MTDQGQAARAPEGQPADPLNALLLRLLRGRAAPEAWAWLEKALARAQGIVLSRAAQPSAADPRTSSINSFLGDYSAASRRMGKLALALEAREQSQAEAAAPGLPLSHWGADEAARALLLRALPHLPADEYRQLALQCLELGDSREQQSWLRALSLLPQPERFVAAAIDACRTNILQVFEAVACENPYSARHFPELNFNQMVLKSLFMGVALARIEGLRSRLNSELSRMADDYASEREAAGRALPADIWLALAPFASAAALPRVLRYLAEGSSDHRAWAAMGLGWRGGPDARAALQVRRDKESDPRVREAIEGALSGTH